MEIRNPVNIPFRPVQSSPVHPVESSQPALTGSGYERTMGTGFESCKTDNRGGEEEGTKRRPADGPLLDRLNG